MYNRVMENSPICNCKFKCPGSRTVETVAELKKLRNCFVRVRENNTTYFVDCKHEITVISCTPLFVDSYDPDQNVRKLHAQTVYDFENNQAIVYDNQANYRIIKLENPNEQLSM